MREGEVSKGTSAARNRVSLRVSLAGLACWIFLMYKAYKGERYMLPYIGELSAKQAG